jgi:branched-chain amino acid aminotransferase
VTTPGQTRPTTPTGTGTVVPLVWVNGRPADATAPQLVVFDRGFTLADGLFETMRAYGGAIFRLGRHLERLQRGAVRLGIPLPPGLRATVVSAMRTAASAGLREASVRLTVSRGPAPPGIIPPDTPEPTLVFTVHPLPRFAEALYTQGVSACALSGRRNERSTAAGLKTLAYTENILGLFEAQSQGADDGLFLDTDGHLCEATSSNLFVHVRGALVTPPLTCGALPGVTREAVFELAVALGITVEERALGPEELYAASEAFLTSSLREIVPLVRLTGSGLPPSPIGRGVPGSVTTRISAAYADLVRRECGA